MSITYLLSPFVGLFFVGYILNLHNPQTRVPLYYVIQTHPSMRLRDVVHTKSCWQRLLPRMGLNITQSLDELCGPVHIQCT